MYLKSQTYFARNICGVSFLSLIILIFPSTVLGDQKKLPGVLKRRYVHACPQGTERIGEAPPKNTMVFCKQNLVKGSRLEGDFASFYRNGNKKEEGEYVAGRRHGSWSTYYRTGELNKKREYRDGKIVEKETFTVTGEKFVPKKYKKTSKTEDVVNVRSEFYKASRNINTRKETGHKNLGWINKSSRGRR